MLLTYVDESGINYKKDSAGNFEDGPIIIWCGLIVEEQKYFHLERLFYELIKKNLKIKDWEGAEIHAHEIWCQTGKFSTLNKAKARTYFEELVQLIKKLDLKIVLGVKRKSTTLKSVSSQEKEIKQAAFSLLHVLEHTLATLNETTILIADKAGAENKISILEELYFDRTKWRYNPGANKNRVMKSSYDFEARACFLLDQVHHTESKKSLFIQIVDNITYVIRRVMQQALYTSDPSLGITPDVNKVPISSDNFKWLSRNITMANFNIVKNDVLFLELDNITNTGTSYISNFKSTIA